MWGDNSLGSFVYDGRSTVRSNDLLRENGPRLPVQNDSAYMVSAIQLAYRKWQLWVLQLPNS